LALLLPALLGLVAWRMRWLTPYGALSAFAVGLILFGLGGGRAALPLLTFFFTSSLLSRFGRGRKRSAERLAAKGGTRDSGQVWANGGMAVLLVLLHTYLRHRWPLYRLEPLQLLFLCALATVNADTWATEIGCWIGQTPRSLRDWKPATPGASGAITLAGTLAALAGAAVIPLSVAWLWPLNALEIFVVTWAGFLGNLIDSLLGAGLQVQYRDLTSGELTERTEIGGRVTQRVRGLPWMNNDVVNFLASAGGVLCGYVLLRSAAIFF
jgi:uncharacterized protein (TIGR00297 family)